MPKYFFRAKSLTGEEKTGYLEAENERELAETLRKEGFFLIECKDERKERKRPKLKLFSFFGPSLKEKLLFTRNLQVMVAAGLSLSDALSALSLQSKNEQFKKAILGIREKIIKGESFSEALSWYPNIFSEFFQSMVKVGEETGNLEGVLKILADQMEKEKKLKSRVTGALIYPTIVFLTLILVFVLMMTTVIPKLAATFKELGVSLPPTTRLLISFGNFFGKNWLGVIIFIIFLPFLFSFLSRKKIGKAFFDKIFLKIPLISSIVIQTNLAYTARNLSSLIEAGVALPLSLEITGRTLSNFYFQQSLLKAAQEVKKGFKLSEIFQNFLTIYPPTFIQMLKVGEETGRMGEILFKSADFYEEEVDAILRDFSSVIEPVLMLFVGGAVGFFAISMIQPIYSIMTQIK